MQRLIAIGAGVAVIVLIAATYVATMMGGTDEIFAECSGSQVGGGAVGGPFTLIDETGATADGPADMDDIVDRAKEVEANFATSHPTAERVVREVIDLLVRMGI